MGLIWMVVTPLVMLAVYTFVFGVVFKVRWGAGFGDSKAAFALIMFCGMTVFNIFAESVNGSVGIAEGEGLTVELTGMIFMSFRWMLSAKPL